MASPADKAEIKKGDILTHVNNVALKSFEELRQTLQTLPEGQEVTVGVISNGTATTKKLTPEVKEIDSKKLKIIGIESNVEYLQPKLIVAKADSFGEAVVGVFTRTLAG